VGFELSEIGHGDGASWEARARSPNGTVIIREGG
jgi:hypothetical protein